MNLIPIIREGLRFQENEEFEIKDRKGVNISYKCRFTNKDMQLNINGIWENSSIKMIGMLVKGQYEVAKPPFKPKGGEVYYFIDVSTGYVCRTDYLIGFRRDMIRIGSGNCYQTEEEAEEHVDEWMSKLYGKGWKELLK